MSSRRSEAGKMKPVERAKQPKAPATREPHDVYTWGYGGQGALGNGAFRDELSPYLVSSLRTHGGSLLLSCGFDHTVAVTGDLKARGWGRAQEGQLGLEPSAAELIEVSPRGGSCVLTPALTGLCDGEGAAAVQAIACGGLHTLMMTMPRASRDEPVLFAVGRGRDGQLGLGPDGLHDACTAASALELPSELPPVTISGGGLHSAALSSHGHVFVWGDNGRGQLGLPPRPPPEGDGGGGGAEEAARTLGAEPAAEAAPLTAPLTAPLAASSPHLLASSAFEGRAALEARVPIAVSAADVGGRSFVVRGRRHAPLQVASISCGNYHTAACTLDGQLYTWGANTDGQLGLDDFGDRASPHRVTLTHSSRPLQVACGGRHTIVLGERSEVWSCGCNLHGQLGHGEDFGTEPLKRLIEIDALSDERVVLVACGGAHSAAVCDDGTLYTWGKNHNGQLGHGSVEAELEPRKVAALGGRVAWVACGGSHMAALVRLAHEPLVAHDGDDGSFSDAGDSFTQGSGGLTGRSGGLTGRASHRPPSTSRSSRPGTPGKKAAFGK